MPRVAVDLPGNGYSIEIECGLLRQVGSFAAKGAAPGAVLLAMDANVASAHGSVALDSLRSAGFRTIIHQLVAGEANKTLEAAREMYSTMLEAGIDRGSAVVALGGGVVGDLAGFVAATYMRGIRLIHLPTTLLAMVDASIGGKTAVNFSLRDGFVVKNLIGAFWQPALVLSDPETLRTLPARDFRCGLAECIKHGMIADAGLIDFIESQTSAILEMKSEILVDLITRCARIKAAIVSADERESGKRALLNLGHTFAHVIEPMAELDLRHGEAVAIGLAAAMECAVRTQRLKENERQRVIGVLQRCALPVVMSKSIPLEQLLRGMAHDKKMIGGKWRLILPRGLGAAEIVDDVPLEVIRAAWKSVGGC